MKRIKSACLLQTIHFQLKEGYGRDYAAKLCQQEVETYKQTLNRAHTQYQIDEETVQPDGSILIKIRKQVNSQDCSAYMVPAESSVQ